MPAANWNDYFVPGTQVLKNKEGITDQRKLDRFEREVTALRLAELRQNPVAPTFDLAHMQQIHRRVFQDVYSWAGQIRDVNITKGPAHDLTRFTPTGDIDKLGKDISDLIKAGNNLRGLEKKEFAAEMGVVYGAVNQLHPFREGNGRMTREFMTQLAEGAGYSLDFKKVSPLQWNEAAIESSRGRYGPIEAVFDQISTPSRAIAFDNMQRNEAIARHPELVGAYKKLHEARGADLANVQESVSRELRAGKIIDEGVTPSESLRAIELAAKARGISLHKMGEMGSVEKGEVVARTSRHLLLQTGQGEGIAIERRALGQQLEVGHFARLTLSPAQEVRKEAGKGIENGQQPAHQVEAKAVVQQQQAAAKAPSAEQQRTAGIR